MLLYTIHVYSIIAYIFGKSVRPKKKDFCFSSLRALSSWVRMWPFFCRIRFYSFSWIFFKLKKENRTTNKKVTAENPYQTPKKKRSLARIKFWNIFDEKHLFLALFIWISKNINVKSLYPGLEKSTTVHLCSVQSTSTLISICMQVYFRRDSLLIDNFSPVIFMLAIKGHNMAETLYT